MSAKRKFRYIYGPVPSWRLGSSLGIDPLSARDKICSFDCLYCQIGKTVKFSKIRKIYVLPEEIIKELDCLPQGLHIDYLTFSGMGEPTLAKNLGEIIEEIRRKRKEKIAVLTNSSLMDKPDVRRDLSLADLVVAKLDAADKEAFERLNRPMKKIEFETILGGIKQFRKEYHTKLALQIMFIKENRTAAREIAQLAREIGPDEVQINTPLRPSPTPALLREEIEDISACFKDMKVVTVYQAKKREVEPVSEEETLRRRGKV